MFIAGITEACQVGSQQGCPVHRGQSSLSFWLCGCGVESFNKTLCASVFGKAPVTGDKQLSPYLSENLFPGHRRKQGAT